MTKYRVWIHIAGAPFRPPYDGYVDVRAANADDAEEAAKGKLKMTSFPDVWTSSMKVTKIEVLQ